MEEICLLVANASMVLQIYQCEPRVGQVTMFVLAKSNPGVNLNSVTVGSPPYANRVNMHLLRVPTP